MNLVRHNKAKIAGGSDFDPISLMSGGIGGRDNARATNLSARSLSQRGKGISLLLHLPPSRGMPSDRKEL